MNTQFRYTGPQRNSRGPVGEPIAIVTRGWWNAPQRGADLEFTPDATGQHAAVWETEMAETIGYGWVNTFGNEAWDSLVSKGWIGQAVG